MASAALLALGALGRGVIILVPRLCRGRAGVGPPSDIRGAFGVAPPFVETINEPFRCSSCFAVIPRYLLALEPAVILLSAMAAFELELFPSSVLTGPSSFRARIVAVDTLRARAGVMVFI